MSDSTEEVSVSSASSALDPFDFLASIDWGEDDATPFESSIPPTASTLSSSSSSVDPLASLYEAVPTRYVSPRASPEPLDETSARACSRVCPVTREETLWYLAIGSMINPTSLALRKLTPIESYPCVLRGWRLVFVGDCGMASIVECNSGHRSLANHHTPRDDFHGVLHRLTREQMNKLDVIENSYERLEVDVECYDGTMQRALVYKMLESKLDPSKPDALPSERYIDIISRGCVHFGVRREYIEWLRSHACVPRKKPSQYRKIPIHSLHQSGMKKLYMTAEELAKYDGRPIEDDEDEDQDEVDKDAGYDDDDEESTRVTLESMSSPTMMTRHDEEPCSISHQTVASCTNLLSPTSSCITSPSTSPPSCSIASTSSAASSSSSSSSPTLGAPIVSPCVVTSSSPVPPPRACYPLRIAVNKRILEWCGDLTQPLLYNTYEFMRHNFGGTDLTWSYTQVFYEPIYPIVSSYEEMSSEHRAMIEDIFAEKVLNMNESRREWKLVGFLSRSEQKSSQRVGAQKLRELHRRRDQSLERMLLAEEDECDEVESQPHTDAMTPTGESARVAPITTTPRRRRLISPDFESNIFFSLSLEDHSGASSTCFAHCCANAQPFSTQRVHHQHTRTTRRRAKNYPAGRNGNGDNAVNVDATECRSNPGGAQSASMRLTSGTSNTMKRPVRTEMNRRHSIDGVGLHAVTHLAPTGAREASSASHTSTTAINVALASPMTPLSSPMFMPPIGAGATAPSSSSSFAQLLSPCAIPLPSFVYPLVCDSRRHRPRAQSICDGELCAVQSMSPNSSTAHVLCFSPTRQQSMNEDHTTSNETHETVRVVAIDAPTG